MNNLNQPLDFTSFPGEINTSPVTCLGKTFEDERARRAHFLEQLRHKLVAPEFRQVPGFPHATEEAILARSDPPYYTTCPNPWLPEVMQEWMTLQDPQSSYYREPFAADVSEGKNDPIFNAHSYHTKVPHKAIMRFLLHYTHPNDIVFDGFCGTGMTGVAAQLCGNKQAVEELGYRVLEDGTILQPQEEENEKIAWRPFAKLGMRRAILTDLSPAATFIAYHYNTPVNLPAFEQEARQILQTVEAEWGWMYQTLHTGINQEEAKRVPVEELKKVILGEATCPSWLILGRVNYTVWSEVFTCPQCAGEVVFWEAAVAPKTRQMKEQFPCPHCNALLTKRRLERAWVTVFDKVISQTVRQPKQVPVLINYSVEKQRFEKTPDAFDLALLNKIEESDLADWFPTETLVKGDKMSEPLRLGMTYLHHFYTKRNLKVLAALRQRCHFHQYLIFQAIVATLCSKLVRYNLGRRGNGPLNGTLYLSSLTAEANVLKVFSGKIADFVKAQSVPSSNLISTQSATQLSCGDNTIDYIFLDPPFGSNLMYSELNFLWEAWLKIFTNTQTEAIVNKTQGKNLHDYRTLMQQCFQEAFRILKPGRWMTVEFSNTQASVWNTIQTTLQEVGFVIANVSALDKQQRSFNAVTSATSVKQDLIISAYKPNDGLEERFAKAAGTEAGVWEFVRSHLKYLPISKTKGGELEFIVERDPRILYDRLLAYFVQHGHFVPVSSQEFQVGLLQRFPERDGMVFLPEQVTEYERKRQLVLQSPQMEIAVADERSAIDWLRNFLKKRPSTYQDLHPEFMKILGAGWKKYERLPELEELLELNFLKYEGTGEVPSQIHSYLSQNFKALRNLLKDDSVLQQRAAERWYVPDPHKAQDLEKLREKHLLREFESYRQGQPRRLKLFRLEAMRAGFKKAWGEGNFALIVEMAEKIPELVLQEDEKLLLWYTNAVTRMENSGFSG